MEIKLYLIKDEDYIAHINDKVGMYGQLTALTRETRDLLAENKAAAALRLLAKYEKAAKAAFETWGIPVSYIATGNAAELSELMENDLLPLNELMECDGPPCCAVAEEYDDKYGTGDDDDCEDDVVCMAEELLHIVQAMTENVGRALDVCTRLIRTEYAV